MTVPVIAIDGPSASGKGTVACRVAEALGFHYLESGALYRLVALVSLREGIALTEAARVAEIARRLDASFRDGQVFLAGQNVSEHLRSEECGKRASEVAAVPELREALLARQRAFRQPPGLVADGRDMASVVFPDAGLKVFLTASVAARAQRRYKQLIAKGISANLRTLSRDLEDRDARDAGRSVAPLAIAPGARLLDSTPLTVDEVVGQILDWYRESAPRAKD
ncbi:MAG: (d)CMP kinase [Betaproteobacteria bacterium]|nr:(d)CMP kinase [Betaproteobacteria bacterium]